MRLFRAHGLGNDYLVLVDGPRLDPELVRRLCDRHTGVGSDGILEPTDTARADHGVTIWNPDGSIAEKSGNGLRIHAFWLSRDRGAGVSFTIDTGHDVVGCEVDGAMVRVEMGRVQILDTSPVEVDGVSLPATSLSVGNPHCVLLRDEPDLDALPWRRWGATLEVDPRFPNRTNVQIAASRAPGRLEARIWERGAGETLASGSSSCAVAAAAVHAGLQAADAPLTVSMPGGALEVTIRSDRSVLLRGPVAPVAMIELDPAWLGGTGL
jgi:diaminopimelate epimerase